MQELTTIPDLLDKLVSKVIPIYTTKNPDPITGEVDCPLKRTHKDGKRFMMKKKIKDIIRFYDPTAKD